MKYDKRRYLFIVKYAKINIRDLLFFYRKTFGDIIYLKSSPKIIYEKEKWFVLRVSHRYLNHLRATIALYGEGNLYTLIVSGSIRSLVSNLKSRTEGKIYVDELQACYQKRNLKKKAD